MIDPNRLEDKTVAEVKKLIAEGFAKRPTDELVKLLSHSDMRVRQEAQFALVDRGAVATLAMVAWRDQGLARLHAIWGLGQLGRKQTAFADAAADVLEKLTKSEVEKDVEVRRRP